MTEIDKDQIYCSVDLEFTGFDPSRDQILEIGFAFFKYAENGFEILEQWDQVFKPSIEVHPKILGLTGISQEELDIAPEFSEHREFLQEKLGDAIIVGHNPVMDVKFLEAYGLKLSGKVIDTLELVQFILPTHHSYNLENLVHYFGIKHQDNHQSHRALADALSTIALLENLVRIHNQFSQKLHSELEEIYSKSKFLWTELLKHHFTVKSLQSNDSLTDLKSKPKVSLLKLSDGLITVDNLAVDHEARVALGMQEENSETVLAVQDSNTVMRLWQDDLVHGVFKSEDTFSKSAFESFLERATTSEELRFCLKVIVWLNTNWQHEVVLDLNISFFGGQFKSSIVGGKSKFPKGKILCADYSTLQSLQIENYNLVVCDIQNFERFMSSGSGTRLSWGGVMYALKMIYNPENDYGNLELKDEVISLMASTDLFFSLVYMLLSSTFQSSSYVTMSELEGNHQHIYKRLQTAADNLREKLIVTNEKVKSVELTRVISYLETFFDITENRVKWVNVDERNLSLHDQPIDISSSIDSVLKNYTNVKFTETLTNADLLSYYVVRLGLHTEVSEFPSKLLPNKLSIIQNPARLNDSELYDISTNSALPMVILFPNIVEVKNFYNEHYQEIKKKAQLLAQGYSGGGNKMFRNFSINENSILLLTPEFMSKQNYKISAQTIIITQLPSVDATHPYTLALLNHWKKQFPNLVSLFSLSKITLALKKLKLNHSVSVQIYNSFEKDFFVDKQY